MARPALSALVVARDEEAQLDDCLRSLAFADEIRAAVAGADGGYFLIPVDNYVGGRLVRHGWGASFGTTAVARLSARGCKRWNTGARVHPPMTLSGPQRRLKTPLLHYVDRDISDMLMRFDRYTTLRALDLIDSGDIGTLPANLRRLVMRFHKCFVFPARLPGRRHGADDRAPGGPLPARLAHQGADGGQGRDGAPVRRPRRGARGARGGEFILH